MTTANTINEILLIINHLAIAAPWLSRCSATFALN